MNPLIRCGDNPQRKSWTVYSKYKAVCFRTSITAGLISRSQQTVRWIKLWPCRCKRTRRLRWSHCRPHAWWVWIRSLCWIRWNPESQLKITRSLGAAMVQIAKTQTAS